MNFPGPALPGPVNHFIYGVIILARSTDNDNRYGNEQYSFLQNLSHEVRTPMNAIVGLSELLYRRSTDLEEREYLLAMQAATQNLLMVINNVVDYDELQAGTLSLHIEPTNLINVISEVINMAKLVVGDRDVSFITDINPLLPITMELDGARLKQILFYFLSNAAKNTKWGDIAISVDFADESKNAVRFKVENTEPGVFVMGDLVSALGSELVTEISENGPMTVSFDLDIVIPEGMEEEAPIKAPGSYAICLKNKRERDVVASYFARTNVNHRVMDNPTELFIISKEERPEYLITDYEKMAKIRDVKEFADLNVKTIGIASQTEDVSKSDKAVLKRPIFYPDLLRILTEQEAEEEDLVLEGVRILVVDDNAINLKVGEGLIRPFGAIVDTATGGEEAIRMIHKTRYDLVFMDHMMPEMSGVEAVKIIRAAGDPYFKELPIVALTADVIEESRQKFYDAGMNDFLAKPIRLPELDAILRKWIAKSKQSEGRKAEESEEAPMFNIDNSNLEHINLQIGLSYTGGNGRMYTNILEDFMRTAPQKAIMLTKLLTDEDVGRYTIEIHALKSLSKTIGATKLSNLSEALERKGHKRDLEGIIADHNEMISELEGVEKDISNVIKSSQPSEKKIPLAEDKAKDALREIYHAIRDFDYDTAERLIGELDRYEYDDIAEPCFNDLKACVDNIDYEGTGKQAVRMLAML